MLPRESKTEAAPLGVESKTVRDATLPTVNITWVGPFLAKNPELKLKHPPGHDTSAPKLMAGASKNPFVYWCLKSEEKDYQKEFKKEIAAGNFQVKSIEDFVNQKFDDPVINKLMLEVKEIFAIVLNEDDPNNLAFGCDKAFVKDLFTICLMVINGGWVIDSNLIPKDGEEIIFPHLDTFNAPIMLAEGEELGIVDVWTMFSPANNKMAIHFLEEAIKRKAIIKEMRANPESHKSQEYNKLLGDAICGPIRKAAKAQEINTIDALDFFGLPTMDLNSVYVSEGYTQGKGHVSKVFMSTHWHADRPNLLNHIPPIIRAAYFGNVGLLDQLITNGANPETTIPFSPDLVDLITKETKGKINRDIIGGEDGEIIYVKAVDIAKNVARVHGSLSHTICAAILLNAQSRSHPDDSAEQKLAKTEYAKDAKLVTMDIVQKACVEALHECDGRFKIGVHSAGTFSEVKDHPDLVRLKSWYESKVGNFSDLGPLKFLIGSSTLDEIGAAFRDALIKKLNFVPDEILAKIDLILPGRPGYQIPKTITI